MSALYFQILYLTETANLSLPGNSQPVLLQESTFLQFLLTAEIYNLRMCSFCHATSLFIIIVQYQIIIHGLLGEHLLLHLLINFKIAMTDNMVRSNIQHNRDMRAEILGCFHLIAGNLRYNTAVFASLYCFLTERNTDIAANTSISITGTH